MHNGPAERINTESERARTKLPAHLREEVVVVVAAVEGERRRGDLERQKLPLDLIACTSAFKWVINYT